MLITNIMANKLFENKNYLIRTICENNPNEVLDRCVENGYNDTGEIEDLIVYVKQFKNDTKTLKQLLSVSILEKNLSEKQRKEVIEAQKINKKIAKMKYTKLNGSATDRLFGKKHCYCANSLTGEITYAGKQTSYSCRKICKGLRPTKEDFK